VIPGTLFPYVFITIACGAISGFHSLIASGTTPKMIARERDILPISYGAMVLEGFVGVIALIAACALQPADYFAINTDPKHLPAVALVAAHAPAPAHEVEPAAHDELLKVASAAFCCMIARWSRRKSWYWTTTPTRWSNNFFENLFGFEWELTKSPGGAQPESRS
jgi:carbon starvation protein CstA